jgi:hypothetical protein
MFQIIPTKGYMDGYGKTEVENLRMQTRNVMT